MSSLNPLNGIFVDTANGKVFDKIYERFIRSKMDYQDWYEKKRIDHDRRHVGRDQACPLSQPSRKK
jgi:hypothetical protein